MWEKQTCKMQPPSRTVDFPRFMSSGSHSAPISLRSKSKAALAELPHSFSPSGVSLHPASSKAAILRLTKSITSVFLAFHCLAFTRKITFFQERGNKWMINECGIFLFFYCCRKLPMNGDFHWTVQKMSNTNTPKKSIWNNYKLKAVIMEPSNDLF